MAYKKHAPGKGRGRAEQELLYDPDVPTPSHAERARTLVAQLRTGTLCTVSKQPPGYPYGSFVTFGLDDGAPVFLISALAEHTKNLEEDPRSSLLVAEPGDGDPLARGRVTLIGSPAQMTAVDRYGFEMSATTALGPRPIRLAFTKPVDTAKAVREELVALATKARAEGS